MYITGNHRIRVVKYCLCAVCKDYFDFCAAFFDKVAVIRHIIHSRKRVNAVAEQFSVFFKRQHIAVRVDARFVKSVYRNKFVADFIRRITEHQNYLFRTFCDTFQTYCKTVAGKYGENNADGASAEFCFDVFRDIVYCCVIAL